MEPIKTLGVDHVGLAVLNLDATRDFFIHTLGFRHIGEIPDYPAVFVSDGTTMITLWQVTAPEIANRFDRHENIGLHHMALRVASQDELQTVYQRLDATEGVDIESPPVPLTSGGGAHMMCIEPGGIRIEFIARD